MIKCDRPPLPLIQYTFSFFSGHGSEQSFSKALNRLTEPKAASALSSPLVSSVLYTSMEGVASATTVAGSRLVETEILSDSLIDEIMKVCMAMLCPLA